MTPDENIEKRLGMLEHQVRSLCVLAITNQLSDEELAINRRVMSGIAAVGTKYLNEIKAREKLDELEWQKKILLEDYPQLREES
jgi:hypothetical protein